MSSENRQQNREELNEKEVKIKYVFDKKTRDKIANIRMTARWNIQKLVFDFYGLWVVKESQIPELQGIVKETSQKLSEIDPSLKAHLIAIPLDEEGIRQGELYHQMLYALKHQVITKILERIENIQGKIHKNSKTGLLRLIDRLHELNIFDDQDITDRLNVIKERVIEEEIETLKEELNEELYQLKKSRFAYLEI
jgi:hypothetical protein